MCNGRFIVPFDGSLRGDFCCYLNFMPPIFRLFYLFIEPDRTCVYRSTERRENNRDRRTDIEGLTNCHISIIPWVHCPLVSTARSTVYLFPMCLYIQGSLYAYIAETDRDTQALTDRQTYILR